MRLSELESDLQLELCKFMTVERIKELKEHHKAIIEQKESDW